MGRKDRQVKIRGYRVELDELESIISEHPDLQDVAVVTPASANYTDGDGKASIGCYYTCNGSEITEKQVRDFARDRLLPQVLSLTRFSRLDQMPLTANGKVNRRELAALFAASETLIVDPVQPVEPATVREQILAMWEELLTIEDVDNEANFFELGGDSMLAIRLLRRLREELHPEVKLGDVYEFPTISQLSDRVSQLIA
jgi:acyl carrier protein